MTPSNLQEVLDESGNIVELLRNSQIGAYIYPVVPYEFSNWRREQRAWRDSAVLFDQSHHMVNFFFKGPDALKMVSDTAINSVANFPVNMAKQYVPTTPAGHVIGDGILFHLDDEEFVWVGRAPVANWLKYQAETGGYKLDFELDDRSPGRPYGKAVTRAYWRFQIQGPNAWPVIEKLNGGPVEQLKFFRMAEMNVAGQRVRTLRHGMAGEPGLELWGPYETYDETREAILEAGAEFGLLPCGARAYASNTLESGWIPSPLPAIYTGEELRGYREWLAPTATRRPTRSPAASSQTTSRTTTRTPSSWATPTWSSSTTTSSAATRSSRSIRPPSARRSRWHGSPTTSPRSSIRCSTSTARATSSSTCRSPTTAPRTSTRCSIPTATSSGTRCSPATAPTRSARCRWRRSIREIELGTEVHVVWGEPDGGTRKTTVEPHKQISIRAIVSPAPYSETARLEYAEGWRTGARR